MALDGTQVFSSKTLHCDHCRVAEHRDGSRTYSHQIVTAAVVHPTSSTSLPLGAEPIGRADGATKNDCEQEAANQSRWAQGRGRMGDSTPGRDAQGRTLRTLCTASLAYRELHFQKP